MRLLILCWGVTYTPLWNQRPHRGCPTTWNWPRLNTKCEIYDLHRSFERFLWNFKEHERSKHHEEGLGLRSLFDVFKVLLLSLSETLEYNKLRVSILCGINTARGINLKQLNGAGGHKLGSLCLS
ncbi:hypothetical protein H5410_052835 [Solanum commersonii]|uniref:Uncharacterized protein n=1 Tax=Solanum commersonii TaxID=4109 RepID=A0A9J5X5B0_SOLCO|nr:hypothetical protein H5410_052835 [Solanum commersonii]